MFHPDISSMREIYPPRSKRCDGKSISLRRARSAVACSAGPALCKTC